MTSPSNVDIVVRPPLPDPDDLIHQVVDMFGGRYECVGVMFDDRKTSTYWTRRFPGDADIPTLVTVRVGEGYVALRIVKSNGVHPYIKLKAVHDL
jgi:hypothetical protein